MQSVRGLKGICIRATFWGFDQVVCSLRRRNAIRTSQLATISSRLQTSKTMVRQRPTDPGCHDGHRRETPIGSEPKNDQEDERPQREPAASAEKADKKTEDHAEPPPYRPQYIWFNLISISLIHLVGAYAIITTLCRITFLTWVWSFFLGGVGGFGVTAGVHRLWTHRAYSATWQLRAILAVCYSVAGQNTIFEWVRDHRVHHKFSETDADPHNAHRGFFFAHVGWLMQKKHPEVLSKGRAIDMSDILADPIVRFHLKYFTPLKLVFCFMIPVIVPHYVWGETWYNSIMSPGLVRYVLGLNFTWLVNSAAHIWGNRPFDRRISPVENISVAILAMGEGWHNYHHVFPWDYKAAELGDYAFNVTTFWLDQFAKIGWAYNLKTPSEELIRKVAETHGDGSHPVHGHGGHCEEIAPPETPIEAIGRVVKYVIHSNHQIK